MKLFRIVLILNFLALPFLFSNISFADESDQPEQTSTAQSKDKKPSTFQSTASIIAQKLLPFKLVKDFNSLRDAGVVVEYMRLWSAPVSENANVGFLINTQNVGAGLNFKISI